MGTQPKLPKKFGWNKALNEIGSDDTGMVAISYSPANYFDEEGVKEEYRFPTLDLTIWDCSRKISLDFSIENKSDIKLRKNKINKLRKSLDVLESKLTEEAAFITACEKHG